MNPLRGTVRDTSMPVWVAVTGQNIYDAAIDLCQRLGRPVPTKDPDRRAGRTTQHSPEQRREPVGVKERFATTSCAGVTS
jgi:hypothetical protein